MFLYPAVCKHHTNSLRGYRFSSGGQARIAVVAGFGGARLLTSSLRFASPAEVVFASLRRPRPSPLRFAGRGRLRFASPAEAVSASLRRAEAGLRLFAAEKLLRRHGRGDQPPPGFPSPHGFRLDISSYYVAQAFQSRIAGFRRLSSRLLREDETRDKNVPQTRRQECLRYIKVGTALGTATARQADETSRRDRRSPHQNSTRIPKLNFCVGGVRPSRPQQRGMDRRLENVPWLEGSKLLHPGDGCTPAWPRPGQCFEQPIMPWVQLMK